jgi:hypothetical protein
MYILAAILIVVGILAIRRYPKLAQLCMALGVMALLVAALQLEAEVQAALEPLFQSLE